MSDQRGQGAAPGWYADPTGLAGVRWWDGGQWTAHTAPRPDTGPGAPLAGRPQLPATTPVYTPFIWAYVLLPLLSAAATLFYQPELPTLSASGRYTQLPLSATFTPGYFVLIGVGFIATAAMIVMAYLDHRLLVRRGVVRPFPWAWSFLALVSGGMLVYAIGRSVVVRQVARPRGLAPIWVLIGTIVVGIVVVIAWSVLLFARIATQLPLHPQAG